MWEWATRDFVSFVKQVCNTDAFIYIDYVYTIPNRFPHSSMKKHLSDTECTTFRS
jgi:hypothetical protein